MISHSPEETFEFAKQLSGQLAYPAIVLLSGDLGAGKTVFTKGIAAALGIDPDEVTSPSFTLINSHQGSGKTLHHVDLYRLDAVTTSDLGLDEMFEEDNSVTVIEWAERLKSAPTNSIRVRLEYLSDNERNISIDTDAQ